MFPRAETSSFRKQRLDHEEVKSPDATRIQLIQVTRSGSHSLTRIRSAVPASKQLFELQTIDFLNNDIGSDDLGKRDLGKLRAIMISNCRCDKRSLSYRFPEKNIPIERV